VQEFVPAHTGHTKPTTGSGLLRCRRGSWNLTGRPRIGAGVRVYAKRLQCHVERSLYMAEGTRRHHSHGGFAHGADLGPVQLFYEELDWAEGFLVAGSWPLVHALTGRHAGPMLMSTTTPTSTPVLRLSRATSIAAERPFTTGLAEGGPAGKLGMIVIEEMLAHAILVVFVAPVLRQTRQVDISLATLVAPVYVHGRGLGWPRHRPASATRGTRGAQRRRIASSRLRTGACDVVVGDSRSYCAASHSTVVYYS
jgi:hypothetical protein